MKLPTLSFLFLTMTATTGYAWTSWLGVLEDWPIQSRDKLESSNDLKYEARVRPLFVRVDKNLWQSAPRPGDPKPSATLPKAFSWDVCFSGRGEGQLTATLVPEGIPTMTPPYRLRQEDRAPWRTRRSNDYAGWLATPVYKPILLTSSMNSSCKDPDKWKLVSGQRVHSKLPAMLDELRKYFNSNDPGITPYPFEDREVKIYKTWASPKQGYYVAVKTRPKDPTVETFQISPTGTVTRLGRDMMLVDAGDFDGDGSTKILFKRHSEKKDVYELYVNGKKMAESIWDYP